MNNVSKKTYLSIILIGVLVLTGCAQTAKIQQDYLHNLVVKDSSYFSNNIKQSKSPNERNLWQLLYIQALYREDQIDKAQKEYDALSAESLNTENRAEYYLLGAELAFKQERYSETVKRLKRVDRKKIKGAQIDRYFETRLAIQEKNKSNDLVILRSYIEWEKNREEDSKANILDQTWQKLKSMSQQNISSMTLTGSHTDSVLKGWLELLALYKESKNNSDIKTALETWQNKNSRHPASNIANQWFFDDAISKEIANVDLRIALLLPMTSQAKVFGDAISEGFKRAMKEKSLDGEINLNIYDTDAQTIPAIINLIKERKDNIIVGPLIKNQVSQLIQAAVDMPVLALNRIDTHNVQKQFCYFSLAPEDEAMSAANRIYNQKKTKPLLILPKGEMGIRIAQAFADKWVSLGGNNNVQVYYFDAKQLNRFSNHFSLRGEPVVAKVQSQSNTMPITNNVDATYIYAFQQELFLIKPVIEAEAIKRGIHNQLSIYAGSRSHNAGDVYDLELNGMEFSEIPLIAQADKNVSNELSDAIKQDNTLVRLYAMGKDAWSLLINYPQLLDRGYQLDGYSGRISVDNHCVIHRELMWLKYTNGEIKLVP